MGYLRYEDSQAAKAIQPWWQQYGGSLTEELRRIESLGLPLEEKRALIVETKTKLFTETTSPEFRTTYQAQIAADQAKIQKQLREHEAEMARNKTLAIGATAVVGGLILLPAVLGGSAQATVAIADIPAGSTAAASGLPAGTITGAAATTGGGLLGAIGSVVKVITDTVGGVVGAATKAIPTIVEVTGGVAKYLTAKEQAAQKQAELEIAKQAALVPANQPGSNIAGQLSELLRGLFGAPAPATPPLIEPGQVQEAPAANWPLLGLLGVGAYLLLKRMR